MMMPEWVPQVKDTTYATPLRESLPSRRRSLLYLFFKYRIHHSYI